jgi:hypothetical protein
MAYENAEERMDRLETVLMTFIRHTDQGMEEMRRGMDETRRGLDETRRGLDEMHRAGAALRAEIHQDIAEMRQWRVQAQKQWGEIAQKMGTFVEDIVAPNVPRIGQEIFALGGPDEEELFSGPRLRVRHPCDNSRIREFDYIYATRRGWIVVESKSDPKLKDVDVFREMLSEIREYFPQYAQLVLHPIFASLYVPDHVRAYCTRHGIYAIGMGPETMQILNLSDLPPRTTASSK